MFKTLATCAVIAAAAAFALPEPANAKEIRPDGLRTGDQVEVSDQRRRYRYRYGYNRHYGPRYYGPRYYGPPPAYHGPYGPYGAYGYAPYYRPGPFFSVGPRGFRFGVW